MSAIEDRIAELTAELELGRRSKPIEPPNPAPQAEAGSIPGKASEAQKETPAARREMATPETPELPARSGRGMQFYLDDTDRKTIHGLAFWFGSQDRRVSDSQVIKAAIRFASVQPCAAAGDLR